MLSSKFKASISTCYTFETGPRKTTDIDAEARFLGGIEQRNPFLLEDGRTLPWAVNQWAGRLVRQVYVVRVCLFENC